MPIRKDLLHHYRGATWREIRKRILARSKNKCEHCQVPNATRVWRGAMGMWQLDDCGSPWHQSNGNTTTFEPHNQRLVRIVLTIAHLNHDPSDNREHNLAALCQWCHLHHDQVLHTLHARATRATKNDLRRPLIQAILRGTDMEAKWKNEE